jgi:hypothetical protein
MIITKMALARRTFLRGVGATLALPFLDAMTPALSALTRTVGKPSTRLGFVYVPNGIMLREFLPKTEGAGAGFEMPRILKPLAPYQDQLTIVSGLANAAGDALDASSGPHSRVSGCWLSGVRAKRTEGADILAGTTIDQFAARELGKQTPLASLELALEPNFMVGNCEGGYSCAYINTLSWRTPTMPLPMETNPRVVFERLFGEGGGGAAQIAQMRIDRSILDSVSDDLARLQRTLGPGDRRTVNEYFDAIRDVEHRIQQTEQRADASPAAQGPLGIPDAFDEHAKLMFDLMFLTYQADLTRVVTFQIGRELSMRAYTDLGVPEAHHDISHHGNKAEAMEKCARINEFHVGLFAHLVEKMRATPDGDGTLLDHSILLFGASMGDSNVHSPHNLPVALLGGGGGQLPHGGHHMKAPFDTPFMNLGLSLLDKVGVELERVGNSTGRLAGL